MKLLHTADIHLGTNTYGRIDGETGLNTRLLDFKRSFDFMVERALKADIDAFLFAGDAYRTPDPTPTQQRVFAECLKPIADAGIPIVMIIGNHDHPVSFGKASAIDIFRFVSGEVHLFRTPDRTEIETKSGPLQLIALPWPIRSVLLSKDEHRKKPANEVRQFIERKYIEFVERAAADVDPALPTVLMAHLTVQGAEMAGSERTSLIAHEPVFTPAQLAVDPIDYVALGHIHKFQDRHAGEHPPVVYSGSIERVSFKEWEEPKGFCLIDIEAEDGEKTTRFEFVETPARRFVALKIDARDTSSPTEHLLQAIEAADVEGAVVRVRYRIEEDQAGQVDVRRLRQALSKADRIAAIEREVDPIERERRTVVERDATLKEAMQQYVAQHDHLAPIKDKLIAAALEIEAEYEADRRNA